jgi:hypothetical protein
VTCVAARDPLPRPGWLEENLEEVLQGELDLPLRSKPTSRTIVRVTSAVSLHVNVSTGLFPGRLRFVRNRMVRRVMASR